MHFPRRMPPVGSSRYRTSVYQRPLTPGIVSQDRMSVYQIEFWSRGGMIAEVHCFHLRAVGRLLVQYTLGVPCRCESWCAVDTDDVPRIIRELPRMVRDALRRNRISIEGCHIEVQCAGGQRFLAGLG